MGVYHRKEGFYIMYKAHINDATKKVQSIKEHSENTALLCEQYSIFELKKITFLIGLLHDIGKYQYSFQERINGKNIKVEHSTCGAIEAGKKYKSALALIIMYCIAGHHTGIPNGGFPTDSQDMPTLMGRIKRKFENYYEYEKELNIPDINSKEFGNLIAKDCINKNILIDKFAFFTRYCFSCLVDADSVDTAKFCNGINEKQLNSDFKICLKNINYVLNSFVCKTQLQKCRASIQKQVFLNLCENADIFIMNMPTGSGKTLCSMKFALEKAINENKKRIIYVIPYNSIIDQTVDVFENIFGSYADILRHQSTFTIEDDNEKDEDYKLIVKHATENWNAQIIITTAVQFFESIYSNKRSKLRKMHNMADSILVFDEVHTMPLKYLQPCLEGISFIAKYLNSKAIFLTATMPDFEKLINRYVMPSVSVKNLIGDYSLFNYFQKCNYHNINEITKENLVEMARCFPTSLIIVNKRKTAREIYQMCQGKKYHLSTYMTAFDRIRVIKEIKEDILKLEQEFDDINLVPDDRKIIVISTSLIEAGVDMDFYTVFREMSGLEHILQSGGRCNREGKRQTADVFVFEFEEEKEKPKKDINAEITRGIFEKYKDISSRECIDYYYNKVFEVENEKITKNAMYQYTQDIRSIPFENYSKDFSLIESDSISVIAVCDDISRSLMEDIIKNGYGDIRKLQKYTFSIYPFEFEILRQQNVVADFGSGIWCLTNDDYYDKNIGVKFEAQDYFL